MKTNQILSLATPQCSFIHRSVGEPAEGSLTRYPTLTKVNRLKSPFTGMSGYGVQSLLKGPLSGGELALSHILNRKVQL